MIDKSALEERIADEKSDSEMYEDMAKQYPEFCQIFRDIAREERSHATLIEFIISKV